MIKTKFSKTFDECLTLAYLFQSEFLVDKTLYTDASPAGTYSLVDTVGTNSYSEATADDKRYYFYVIALNSYRESSACTAVWIEVPVGMV